MCAPGRSVPASEVTPLADLGPADVGPTSTGCDLHHASNDGVGPGGLTVLVEYEGYSPASSPREAEPTPMPTSMPDGALKRQMGGVDHGRRD